MLHQCHNLFDAFDHIHYIKHCNFYMHIILLLNIITTIIKISNIIIPSSYLGAFYYCRYYYINVNKFYHSSFFFFFFRSNLLFYVWVNNMVYESISSNWRIMFTPHGCREENVSSRCKVDIIVHSDSDVRRYWLHRYCSIYLINFSTFYMNLSLSKRSYE